MKRIIYTLLFVLISVAANGQAKYVFYFIGDGMGVNQVNGTEMYAAELQNGTIGVQPLLFTQFPVATVATTFSGTNSVTDSAAAGTALATGKKTYNHAISVDKDKNPIQTLAEKAKRAGKKVGVTTSVSVDHATPAAFYAHQPDRNMYYEIALDLPKAGFDFYAGGGFLKPNKTFEKKDAPDIFPIFEEAGYTVARGYNDYKNKASKAEKMILIQEEGASPSCLPYAIDRKPGDLTLAQITESAIDFLTKDNKKGFFLMVEGGKIDWACHSNDATTTFKEIQDMDDAIKVAYEFYKKHPKETLIVVTADHETGGLGLGTGRYELNLKALQYQKQSADELSRHISELRKTKDNKVTWEDMKAFLGEKMGFWKELPVSWEQEKMLRDEFEKSFIKHKVVYAESLYSKSEPMAACAKKVMNEIAMVGWVSGGHSAGYVPVFAIGAGSQLFGEKIDNTEIPKRIAKAAKY
ncbi:alkaline phosphatase [Bacteroides pyogenes]|uniref:alkaline phosphatase n=1 Tax=Bacteroides pyogenes TaxID=310300 RepID=UPI001F3FEA4D|nr:alkaline phosphatase [Bacteroides pyogenes]MCF2707897.1 alkaline phosphatase [Bacteroides pyogenes]